MKNINFSFANWNRITPPWLKNIADTLLGMIIVIDPLMLAMPDFKGKEWVIWCWNAFVVLFKFFTKFTTIKNTTNEGVINKCD